MGWLWSRLALTATNFVIEAEFKVSGESSHLFGDGLAIWLTKDRAKPGPVFGSADNFEGLGVFLDTYANARHSYSFPRITAMFGNGKISYDFANDGDSQSIGGCSANFRRTNVATKVKITYVKDAFLDVKIQHKAWDDWTDCFYVEKISLPASPFLGFTAMTGDVSDAHDIISVTTYSAVLSSPDAQRDKLKIAGFFGGQDSSSSGSWLGFFFKLFVIVGICAGGYYGHQWYRRRNLYAGGGNFGMGRGGFGDMYSNSKRF